METVLDGGLDGREEFPTLYNEREASERLQVKVATLRAWRRKKKGPPFLRLGKSVRYQRSDLRNYLTAAIVETSR